MHLAQKLSHIILYNKCIKSLLTRKGRLAEIFSRAMHADDPARYFVTYRDFQDLVEVPLQEFLELSDHFAIIPQSRIYQVRRDDEILYQKARP